MMVSDVYPPLIGGQEAEMQILCEGLKNKGHDVVVCTVNHDLLPLVAKENGVKVYRTKGVFQRIPKLYHNPERKFHPPLMDWSIARQLRKIIKVENPDVIHAHGWMLYSVLPANKVRRIPLCVTFHDYGFTCPVRWSPLNRGGICDHPLASFSRCLGCERNDYGIAKSCLSYYFVKINRRFKCDALIFTNPNILEKMKYLKTKKIYLEHPIDTNEFKPMETEKYRDRVLIWAKLDKTKGIDTIFQVAKLLPRYKFDVTFVGDQREYYKTVKPCNVTLLPKLQSKEIPRFINKYPLVMGQFFIGVFGHAELEAMSCGKPVLSYWNKRYDRFYPEPCPILSSKHVNEIANLVVSNIGNDTLGKVSRHWVSRYHNASKVVKKLSSIYDEVLIGKGKNIQRK